MADTVNPFRHASQDTRRTTLRGRVFFFVDGPSPKVLRAGDFLWFHLPDYVPSTPILARERAVAALVDLVADAEVRGMAEGARRARAQVRAALGFSDPEALSFGISS